jgi:hypothetical protein
VAAGGLMTGSSWLLTHRTEQLFDKEFVQSYSSAVLYD